jgi:hypothetical protein
VTPRTSKIQLPHSQPTIDSSENRKSTAHTVAKQRTRHPQQAVNYVSTTTDSDASYDPYAPPKLANHITHFQMILPPSRLQLPPFPKLVVNVLGESSQLTDITSVMELSFGDLAASASRRNRTSFIWHLINGEEVYKDN